MPDAPQRGCAGRTGRLLAALAALVYLFMPNLGIVELLPDNLPFIGNLDELAATALLVAALDLVPWVNSPSRLRWAVLGIIGLVSALYLLNPTAGIVEVIPDNFPIIGNVDDMAAALGVSAVAAQAYYPRLEAARRQQNLPAA